MSLQIETIKNGRLCSWCSAWAINYKGTPFCERHRPSVGRSPNPTDIQSARTVMANGGSLKEASEALGLLSVDLDMAFWRVFGRVK